MSWRRAATGPVIQVPVVILGLGTVGRALLRQILNTRQGLVQRTGLQLIPVALVDSRAFLFAPDGLPDNELQAALGAKEAGRSLTIFSSSHPLADLDRVLAPGTILVDLTASPATASILRAALGDGAGLVLANKRPLSGPWIDAQPLFGSADLRYEATVGAGLPVIATLRTLLGAGDRVTAIEGCMSGTLGYLCTQLERGLSYSAAVSAARELGYTEPDPRDDLSGQDVARKALILARTAGWPLEIQDLTVEALYTEALSALSLADFLETMPALDDAYDRRVRQARANGQVLRYRARIEAGGGQVELAAVPQESSLGALSGPANHVAIYSTLYTDHPLIISGPGAGPEVTAAGVLGDIIDLALHNASFTVHLEG
jgi:homoserine dehydrogenase